MSPEVAHLAATFTVIFLGIGLHEYAHCKMADLAGDPTPRSLGRVTLNLFKHFEVMGSIMIIITSLTGIGVGWGKPAPMTPALMKNPRWDFFAAVAAGPISNIAQAALYGLAFRLLAAAGVEFSPFFLLFLAYGVVINLGLASFNLIPVYPLDGSWLFGLLLPQNASKSWFSFIHRVGAIPLLILLFLPVMTGGAFSPLDYLFAPVIFVAEAFLGVPIGRLLYG